MEAVVIASHCRRQNRLDLACQTSLLLLRSTLATVHGQSPLPESAIAALGTAREQFRYYAGRLWEDCRGHFLEKDELIKGDPTPGAFATYPVRCLTVIELLGMFGLLASQSDAEAELAKEIAQYLARFIDSNIGASHPVSDRWAISIVAAVLLLALSGKNDGVVSFMRLITKWVADYYEEGNFGLASPYATPTEEVSYLLGSPFEAIVPKYRRESYLAVAILDLASVLENPELYDLARNEFLAVDIVLPVIETDDDASQYSLHLGAPRFEPNMPFEEYWRGTDLWKNAPHHHRGIEIYYPERVGTPWDQMALSCILRDRQFVKSWRRILGKTV